MFANKLFLLLITCVLLTFACTSSKKKSPTTSGGGDQVTDQSGKIRELQSQIDTLTTALSKISTQQGDVSQGEFKTIQDALQTMQDEVTGLKGKGGDLSSSEFAEKFAEIMEQMQELAGRVEKVENGKDKEQNEDDKEGEEAETEEEKEETGGDAPVIHVSLVELDGDKTGSVIYESGKKEERTWQEATYVTFHSNVDVDIQTIKYGDLIFTSANTPPYTPLNDTPRGFTMRLPVSVEFNHSGTKYCVKATLTQAHLPKDPTEPLAKCKGCNDVHGEKMKMEDCQ